MKYYTLGKKKYESKYIPYALIRMNKLKNKCNQSKYMSKMEGSNEIFFLNIHVICLT